MANISEYLAKIRSAIYGEEVRGSIHDAIDAMNKESINAEAVAISSRNSAKRQADRAEEEADTSEAWAVGKVNGTPVTSESEQYRNNAEYWAKYAQHYAEGGVRWKGSISFVNIPTEGNLVGDMYSITNKFITDSRFEYGAGTFCPAGTNIIYREDGLWDLSPSNISGYSDAVYDTYEDALEHIHELEDGQTVYIRQSRADAYNSNLAPIEKTIVATRSYAKGRHFVLNGILYKALIAINQGDNIVVGTNAKRATVDDELSSCGSHIGMIIHSTTLDTEAKVIEVYGGESWIQHTGYVLRGGTSADVTANDAQATGGSDDAVVVSHSHSVSTSGGNHAHTYSAPGGGVWCDPYQGVLAASAGSASTTSWSGNLSMSGTAAATGVDGTNANIPAYKSVYIWERTA